MVNFCRKSNIALVTVLTDYCYVIKVIKEHDFDLVILNLWAQSEL